MPLINILDWTWLRKTSELKAISIEASKPEKQIEKKNAWKTKNNQELQDVKQL